MSRTKVYEEEDEEIRKFVRGLRRYITLRAVLIYIIVGIATVGFGFTFYYLLYALLPPSYEDLIFALLMVAFVVGLNLVLQRSLLIHHLPPYTLDIVKKAGFRVREFRHLVFKRAVVYPTPNIYIRIGLIVGYLPFSELRFRSYTVSLTSGKLSDKDDLLGSLIVQKIAEKNLVAWDKESESKRTGFTRKKIGGLRFKTICLPEEVTGRLLQMGKAIREWERSIEKIANIALSVD
ncbi:MAG: hypothetical protein EU536_00670 [Promethearchaeota archaeon]|nr:MAG: hypothetical protein EU536_00670 [Candidatus Lokiarchaeota archaeon]